MSADETVSGYLDALASSAPTPGGGSVVGLINALGCALGEMVSALSAGAADHPEIHEAAERLRRLRYESIEAMARDEAAYASYIAATKLPKSTGEEKAARRAAMQTALVGAAEAPLTLSRIALETLNLLHPIAAHGNTHTLSDVRIGAMLTDVAVHASLINVRVNTALIKDAAIAGGLNEAASRIEKDAKRCRLEIEAALNGRIASRARGPKGPRR